MKKFLFILLSIAIAFVGFLLLSRDRVVNFSFDHPQSPGVAPKILTSTVERKVLAPAPLRSKQGKAVKATLTIQGVLKATNDERAKNHLPPLIINDKLMTIADRKLQDMFARQYFEHVSPSGVDVAGLAKQVGYEYILIGENLALGDYESDAALVGAWIMSPGHRANILNDRFKEIGLAVMEGSFQGQKNWLAVQTFAVSINECPKVDENVKVKIDSEEADIQSRETAIQSLGSEIKGSRTTSPGYNEKVLEYNTKIQEYNVLVDTTKKLIDQYNYAVTSLDDCIRGVPGFFEPQPRTHLKSNSARDMSQFSQGQGVRTKVYPLRYSKSEATQVL